MRAKVSAMILTNEVVNACRCSRANATSGLSATEEHREFPSRALCSPRRTPTSPKASKLAPSLPRGRRNPQYRRRGGSSCRGCRLPFFPPPESWHASCSQGAGSSSRLHPATLPNAPSLLAHRLAQRHHIHPSQRRSCHRTRFSFGAWRVRGRDGKQVRGSGQPAQPDVLPETRLFSEHSPNACASEVQRTSYLGPPSSFPKVLANFRAISACAPDGGGASLLWRSRCQLEHQSDLQGTWCKSG
mmetsp:Transcript_20982/g.53021  ORF Transcript_20982/g.53021 Transcript_20982/m.53021 type:complete len:244 (+) Transcript_20982:152-883(+)